MATFNLILKLIHIFAAIVAVGSNVTYGVWSARAAADSTHAGFALKGIKFIDDRLANPAYGVIFVTGLIMVFTANWGFRPWVITAIILFIAIAVVGFAVYSPLLKRQIALTDAGDTTSPEFERLANRARLIGPILGLLVVVILVMMVFKPSL